MAVPKSRKRARSLVRQISKDHGYLEEEMLQTLPPDARRDVEEALLRKDKMIGSSVITLAKNLYTSKERFVFELLQNADDNSFDKAAASGESPYISFRVFPHRIVIECNEDGFTNEDLKAICSVGKSSKTRSERYIGEKGIGFKSVFMAAWKAHIQSGVFSFSFSHRIGDSGMGMISPVWEDDFEELDTPLTRLTLHLHDTGDTNTRQNAYRIIKEQFHELQETTLLFLKNLRMIRVAFHDSDEEETSSRVYSVETPRSNYAVLKRAMIANRTRREHVKHYHVTTHEATDVPRHDHRDYSNRDPYTSKVVLAFPISETSVPIIEPQHVFAHLPVRPVGFNFIIQADFVTDASRQDIVRDSRRNIALLDEIASSFSKAVLQFCKQDGLRLQWMRYLPDRNDKNWGALWSSLVDKIADRLSRTHVLYCHKSFDRHLAGDLVRLPDNLYDNGQPLFEDGDLEQIVSQQYRESDLNILMDYGLKYSEFGDVIRWLAADLKRGSQSRMKSPTTTASWHTKVAKLLHQPFAEDWTQYKTKLKKMAVLPLSGGNWVSATSGQVFFARIDGIDIPSDTGLRVIDRNINNKHRKKLFRDLDVQTAPTTLIREKILEMYEESDRLPELSLQNSKQHLKFLYLTHHSRASNESYSNIVLFDQNERIRNPSETFMYVATNKSRYTPWELLREAGSFSSPGAPGFMAHYFMNEKYFEDAPQTPTDQELTWVEWFHHHLEIAEYVHFGDTKLSVAAKYLQKHRPERFLGALRIHCIHNQDLLPEFIACVQKAEVLCRDGGYLRLKDTYFPIKKLESLVRKFVGQDAFFPWLWLTKKDSYDTIPEHWDILLRELGVGMPLNDLEFALCMLCYSMQALQENFTLAGRRKLFRLYVYIQAQCRGEGGTIEAKTEIRKTFVDEKAICVPFTNSNTWVSPEDCVWGAVQELHGKFALRIYYESLSFLDHESKRDLEQLFSHTLGISDCTLETYVEELKFLQESGSEDNDTIIVFYREIDRLWRMEGVQRRSEEWLRSEFEAHALIYVASSEGPSWRKTSQCVWSTAARLRDMVSLNIEYEDLKNFFVDTLGVKPVTLKMAIDELKEAGSRQPVSVEEVKASLLTVNSLLCSESDPRQSKLMESNIFPVRYPKKKVKCRSKSTHFFIGDRESLRSSFGDRVRFLDFNLEQVVQLQPFFNWMRIEDRYISRCMRETTSIQDSDVRPIPKRGLEFRHRAHALLRIAKHFGSPRMTTERDSDALYELLRTAKIFAVDTISLELSVSQDGVSHKALGGSINMHLDEKGRNLTVYLPRKKIPQQYAFHKRLPEKLLQWLMTEKDSQIPYQTNDKALNAMKDVWNTPVETIATTLDECSIITISTPNIDPEIEGFSSGSESDIVSETYTGDWNGCEAATQSEDGDHYSDALSEVVHTPPSAPEILYHDIAGHSGRSTGELLTALVTQRNSSTLAVRSAAPEGEDTPLERFLIHDDQYLSVLEKVIASTATSSIPDRNEEGMGQLQGTETSAAWRGGSHISGATQFERDCKVGAAGELFVFELLSRLDPVLPNFSRANWQSNMRRYVNVHPVYADMSPWTGRETSDITYRDTRGILTDLLIRNHYLDRDRWAGQSPKYFIEVKTTTSSCDAPFYMSNAQYQRMRNATLSEGNNNVIYVIFRVYQLDQGDQGPRLRVYVDPESLRLSRVLDFTALTWSVTPG